MQYQIRRTSIVFGILFNVINIQRDWPTQGDSTEWEGISLIRLYVLNCSVIKKTQNEIVHLTFRNLAFHI